MRMIKSTQSAGYLDIRVLSKSLTKTELKHKPRVTPKKSVRVTAQVLTSTVCLG